MSQAGTSPRRTSPPTAAEMTAPTSFSPGRPAPALSAPATTSACRRRARQRRALRPDRADGRAEGQCATPVADARRGTGDGPGPRLQAGSTGPGRTSSLRGSVSRAALKFSNRLRPARLSAERAAVLHCFRQGRCAAFPATHALRRFGRACRSASGELVRNGHCAATDRLPAPVRAACACTLCQRPHPASRSADSRRLLRVDDAARPHPLLRHLNLPGPGGPDRRHHRCAVPKWREP